MSEVKAKKIPMWQKKALTKNVCWKCLYLMEFIWLICVCVCVIAIVKMVSVELDLFVGNIILPI